MGASIILMLLNAVDEYSLKESLFRFRENSVGTP